MLHQRKNRTIRIFISSTFVDMNVERNLLQTKVIPGLKDYCSVKGWQFECVDLRWGVSQEAQDQSRTIDICLNEIRHCRNISPKPNFIVLLGQRYGWIPDGNGMSATEIEVYEGLLSQEYLSSNTIVYDRLLYDVPDKYTNVYIEEDSYPKLQNLKDRLYDFVSKGSLYRQEISFEEYIQDEFKDKFVNHMTMMLKNLVDAEIKESANLDDYHIEHLFQEEIVKTSDPEKYYELISEIDACTSDIVVIKSTDEKKRREILASYALLHHDDCFFRALGRSWLSSDGAGVLKSFLKTYGVKFFPSDSDRKLVERVRGAFRYPDFYKVSPPSSIVIDSLDNLQLQDILLFFTWLPEESKPKVILSLTDDKYLIYAHKELYGIIDVDAESKYGYSDFKQLFDMVCRPENNDSAFVRLALGLLCYSHSGVTEDEILEIAAIDHEYYSSLKENAKHDLPVLDGMMQRIPYSIWSILYHNIKDILVVRNSLGATTFVFDNDGYKNHAIQYLGEEQKSRIYSLIIRYFTSDKVYSKLRALIELPHAYLAIKAYDKLYELLKDHTFCQRLIANGLIDNLMEYVKILRREFNNDIEIAGYLDIMSEFLDKEGDFLCKYAKYDKTCYQRKFDMYCSVNNTKTSVGYIQKAVFLRNCTSASCVSNGIALIVSYPHDYESLCEIIDINSGKLLAMRYIKQDVIERNDSVYSGSLEKSFVDSDKPVVYIYNSHGYMNIWNYVTNKYEHVESSDILRYHDEDFTLPDDFYLDKRESIISCGKIDEHSFYIVTSTSLRLITCESGID